MQISRQNFDFTYVRHREIDPNRVADLERLGIRWRLSELYDGWHLLRHAAAHVLHDDGDALQKGCQSLVLWLGHPDRACGCRWDFFFTVNIRRETVRREG